MNTQKIKFLLAFLLNFEYSRRRLGIFTRHFAKQTRKRKKVFFYISFVLRITVQWKSVRLIIEKKKSGLSSEQ
jgi:hypothetical protein